MADNLISPPPPALFYYCRLLAAPIPPCPPCLALISTLFLCLALTLFAEPERERAPLPRPESLQVWSPPAAMQVRCDVCGTDPAAVLCCADEAALCSACDRRVHRANKLADKHRRVALLQPSGEESAAPAAPLCDVCKERRGLVFCVEDRAILCADCDEPIHSANDLTAKHSRFLLVGARLSTALVHESPPSPDHDDCGSGNGAAEPVVVVPAAICTPQEDSFVAKNSVLECSNKSYAGGGGGGSSISDYLTNICPGWRVDDLLFDDSAFPVASKAGGCYEHEQVPSLDADLFDVVAGRLAGKRAALGFGKAPVASVAVPTAAAAKQHVRVREEYWNCDSDSDAFAVPEISRPPPAKKARPPAAPSSFWCF
ncbi:hypothetical protein U9M48_026232 [Paspalum notatum var. saurae]|uniref:B box-type domain-containing protein n=1 Tax=Paspalum notatum var. saurae TaxID=547442 RepID=A0AAQ3WXX1_PASNO